MPQTLAQFLSNFSHKGWDFNEFFNDMENKEASSMEPRTGGERVLWSIRIVLSGQYKLQMWNGCMKWFHTLHPFHSPPFTKRRKAGLSRHIYHPSKLDIFTCVSAPLSFTRGMPPDQMFLILIKLWKGKTTFNIYVGYFMVLCSKSCEMQVCIFNCNIVVFHV